jgi:hypothetical protein
MDLTVRDAMSAPGGIDTVRTFARLLPTAPNTRSDDFPAWTCTARDAASILVDACSIAEMMRLELPFDRPTQLAQILVGVLQDCMTLRAGFPPRELTHNMV